MKFCDWRVRNAPAKATISDSTAQNGVVCVNSFEMKTHFAFTRLLLLLAIPVAKADAAPRLIEGDGLNLKIVTASNEQISLEPRDKPAAHNWFAASFDGLTLGPTSWRVDMSGTGTQYKGKVAKWQGVHPVISYADPARYETYIWYFKEDGVWISSDPLLRGADREAGNGELPIQSAVAPELATEFLKADDQIWSPWRDIETANANPADNTFSFSTDVATPRATIAMRVPYPNSFEDEFAKRLKAANWPGVSVDEIGQSVEKRPLRVFRLDDPRPTLPLAQQQTVLLFAREQATDHDGSWVLFGALAQLLRDDDAARRLRQNTTWLIIPIVDPDGASHSVWAGLQGQFLPEWNGDTLSSRPEAMSYARYFLERANAGRSLDLNLGFYMLEGKDNPNHLVSVFAPSWSSDALTYFNAKWFPLLQKEHYKTGPTKPIYEGADNGRIGGWLAENLHAYHAVYQVNARVPGDHLALNDLMFLGEMAAQSASDYLWNEGIETHDVAAEFNRKRMEKQRAYYEKEGWPKEPHRFEYDLLLEAFLPPPDELAKLDEKWAQR